MIQHAQYLAEAFIHLVVEKLDQRAIPKYIDDLYNRLGTPDILELERKLEKGEITLIDIERNGK